MTRLVNPTLRPVRPSRVDLFALALCLTECVASIAHAQIVVSLLPESASQQEVIRLADIALVEGADASLAARLAALDIADFPKSLSEIVVELEQVRLRLRLANVTDEAIRFEGPGEIRVVRKPARERLRDDEILAKASQSLAEMWSTDASAVRVRLLQPIKGRSLQGVAITDLDIVVPGHSRPGSIRAKLLVHKNGSLKETLDLTLDVQLSAELLVAVSALARGHTLTDDDLIVRWQPIRKPGPRLTRAEAVGQTLRSSIRLGQVIEPRLLTTIAHNVRAKPVVKSHDVVRLVGRKSSLSVTISNAVALQAGVVGDLIRVRNPSSQKIVVARIVSSAEVEMEL